MSKKPSKPRPGEPLDPLARKQLAVSRRATASPKERDRAVFSNKLPTKALLTPEQRRKVHSETAKRLNAEAKAPGQKKGFRKKYNTDAEKAAAQVQHSLKWQAKASLSHRDIGHFDPSTINWERRLSCKDDLERFDKTYMGGVFRLPWAEEHHIVNHKLQQIILFGGKFCVAMRRAGGKTSLCRGAITWALCYGHRVFPFFIGSKEPKAESALRDIKLQFEKNHLLRQDFPELCHPISKLAEKGYMTKLQQFLGNPTHIDWGSKLVNFPCVLLPKAYAEVYQEHDPDFLIDTTPFGYEGFWIPKSGSSVIRVAGIDGTIRGESVTHPITLEQPRPDLVLIDDVQKDQKAESPILRQKLIALIDGAIEGLAGPDEQIAAMMPCTVTCEGDASDTFVDPTKRRDWNGERCKRVTSWPAGITDYEITNDTPSGVKWNEYYQLWRSPNAIFTPDSAGSAVEVPQDEPKRAKGRGKSAAKAATTMATAPKISETPQETAAGGKSPGPDAAIQSTLPADSDTEGTSDLPRLDQQARRERLNAFYEENRSVLEMGFHVGWPEAYPKEFISAQQHAMEKRFATPEGFLAEDQQIGRKLVPEGEVRITAEQLARKTVDFPQKILPPETEVLVAFLDVQTEVLFWSVFACDYDFNGVIVDYGTWPRMTVPYFTKAQTESWSLITRKFFEAYPNYRDKAIKNSQGKIRAPLEAKVYYALSQAVPELLSRDYVRADTHRKVFQIQRLGIDTRWGEASDAIKRYIREQKRKELMSMSGQAFPPTNRQIEEYEARKGWLFEHNKHRNVKEPKWYYRPRESDGSWFMTTDTNRLKDFVFNRLGTPQGAPASVSLFKATPEQHELFSQHICNSEYPEPVTARGLTKNQWTLREGTAYNNDWLDCVAGCMALASYEGASVKTAEEKARPPARRFSEQLKLKTNRTRN